MLDWASATGRRFSASWLLAFCALAGVHATGAQAATDAAQDTQDVSGELSGLETEVETSATEPGALQLAAQLEDRGDLTGAASVLERYLIANRNAVTPRAEYAILLCRLDDLEAGRFEASKLASLAPGPELVQRVDAACGVADSSDNPMQMKE